ncbi:MAG: methionyl-tRNA formyltransferase [Chloroflexi bacterium RBG_16_48_8]|nr:MAG: methionyl-tRNA formyltransferase [Chloroflexi bacterium RBG_16_48_8]
MRILFMGSPQFAVPSINALASYYTLIGVVTQPDRPAGRGKQLRPSPVKSISQELNLLVLQPEKLRQDDAVSQIQDLQPELIVVAAYGQILPREILNIPSFGCLNIHASLLPRWRGAAPIQAAILHGDEETGTSIMLMDASLDTGPVLSQRTIAIQAHETAGDLSNRLSFLGATLLLETLPGYLRGDIIPVPQDDSSATYAPKIRKSDGALDFNKTSSDLLRQVRAFEPWPTSFFYWGNQRIVVKRAHALPWEKMDPGQVIVIEDYPAITTMDGLLVLKQIHPAGKTIMFGDSFLRGSPEFIEVNLS